MKKHQALEKLNSKLRSAIQIQIGKRARLNEETKRFYFGENKEAAAVYAALRAAGVFTGIYRSRSYFPDEPQGYITQITCDLGGERLPQIGTSGIGRDMFSYGPTLWPAIGEGLERWAFYTFLPSNTKRGRAADFKGSALDLARIAGFSGEKKKIAHPNFKLDFDVESVFSWMKVRSLTSRKRVWAPVQLFSSKHVRQMQKTEALLSPIITTGAATGQSEEAALVSGILECIERDAFVIHWLNRTAPTRIAPSSILDARVKRLLAVAERYRLAIELLYLETDAPVHTICAFAIDNTGVGPATTLASTSSFSLADAIYNSLNSLLSTRSPHRQLFESKREKAVKLSPETLTHEGRMLYWCIPGREKEMEFFFKGPRESYETIEKRRNLHPFPTYKDALNTLVTFFRAKKYDVLYVDILPASIARVVPMLRTVLVRIPQLQPLWLDETLLATGGSRLREIPKALGLESQGPFNALPHPFP